MANILIHRLEVLNVFKYDIMNEINYNCKSTDSISLPEKFFIMIDGCKPIAFDMNKLSEGQVKLYLSYEGFSLFHNDIAKSIMKSEGITFDEALAEATKRRNKRYMELSEWAMDYIKKMEKELREANEIYVKNFC